MPTVNPTGRSADGDVGRSSSGSGKSIDRRSSGTSWRFNASPRTETEECAVTTSSSTPSTNRNRPDGGNCDEIVAYIDNDVDRLSTSSVVDRLEVLVENSFAKIADFAPTSTRRYPEDGVFHSTSESSTTSSGPLHTHRSRTHFNLNKACSDSSETETGRMRRCSIDDCRGDRNHIRAEPVGMLGIECEAKTQADFDAAASQNRSNRSCAARSTTTGARLFRAVPLPVRRRNFSSSEIISPEESPPHLGSSSMLEEVVLASERNWAAWAKTPKNSLRKAFESSSTKRGRSSADVGDVPKPKTSGDDNRPEHLSVAPASHGVKFSTRSNADFTSLTNIGCRLPASFVDLLRSDRPPSSTDGIAAPATKSLQQELFDAESAPVKKETEEENYDEVSETSDDDDDDEFNLNLSSTSSTSSSSTDPLLVRSRQEYAYGDDLDDNDARPRREPEFLKFIPITVPLPPLIPPIPQNKIDRNEWFRAQSAYDLVRRSATTTGGDVPFQTKSESTVMSSPSNSGRLCTNSSRKASAKNLFRLETVMGTIRPFRRNGALVSNKLECLADRRGLGAAAVVATADADADNEHSFPNSPPSRIHYPDPTDDRFDEDLNADFCRLNVSECPNYWATLYVELPARPNATLYNIKVDLACAAVRSFFDPCARVDFVYVRRLRDRMLALMTDRRLEPRFDDERLCVRRFDVVLVLSPDAGGLVRHRNTSFVHSLAAVLEVRSAKVLVMVSGDELPL